MGTRVLVVLTVAIVGFFAFGGTAVSQGPPYAESRDPLSAATSTDASYNWAGYVADQGSYSAVSASWIVPSVTTQTSLAADATWVGIGGVDTHDLIQAGTQALVGSDGETQYEAWYETLPHASQAVPLSVSPGDSVSVALTYVGAGEWHVSFVDNSTGKNYATNVSYDSSFSSAEWVQEMPSLARGGDLIPLDDFGSLTFNNASTVMNGYAKTPLEAQAQPLKMVSAAGDELAVPSTLSKSGVFTVMRTNASAVAVTTPHRVRVLYIQF